MRHFPVSSDLFNTSSSFFTKNQRYLSYGNAFDKIYVLIKLDKANKLVIKLPHPSPGTRKQGWNVCNYDLVFGNANHVVFIISCDYSQRLCEDMDRVGFNARVWCRPEDTVKTARTVIKGQRVTLLNTRFV